jgi:hypothetical protein
VISIERSPVSCVSSCSCDGASSSSDRCILIAGEAVFDRGRGITMAEIGEPALEEGNKNDLLL